MSMQDGTENLTATKVSNIIKTFTAVHIIFWRERNTALHGR